MPHRMLMIDSRAGGGGGGANGFKRSLTLDHTQVGSSDSSNWPLAFAGTFTYLKSAANGGKVDNTGLANNVRFYSDSGLTTLLKFERVIYNASTGAVEFHVKIPTLSHTSDTVIYMKYGAAADTSDASDPTNVWDTNYKCVYHLGDGSTVSASDSTSNAHNGSLISSPTAVTGEIGGGAGFSNGTGAHVAVTAASFLPTSQDLTVSYWIKVATGSGGGAAFSLSGGSDSPNRCQSHTPFSDNNVYWDYGDIGGNGRISCSYSGFFDAWTYVTLLGAGAKNHKEIYLNAVSKISSGTSDTVASTQSNIDVGLGRGTDGSMTGSMDEFRAAFTLRSADWITADYNSQKPSSTFVTIGSEVAL